MRNNLSDTTKRRKRDMKENYTPNPVDEPQSLWTARLCATCYSVYNTPTGLGFSFDPGSSALSPFGLSFSGTLYGQHVSNVPFDTFGQYADWRTSLAARPENQIYDAFWALLENNGLDPNTPNTVFAWLNGLTWNVQLQNTALNTGSAAQGRIPDPSHLVHAGNSWFGLSPINTLHLVADPAGGQAHFDWFNGVELFPLHELFDYLPSLFINPKSQIPQNTSTWKCSGNGGCHQ